MNLRQILSGDNQIIKEIIQAAILEHGAPKIGTAYSDAATQSMYEHYQKPRGTYYVVELNGSIIGGAGIAQLDNYDGNVCELQKMYFRPEARGKGYGKVLMQHCLQVARDYKFASVYLETMGNMLDAQALYKHVGFEHLDGPLGNTGHFSCPIQMVRKL
jgi:putative acetyltransferase